MKALALLFALQLGAEAGTCKGEDPCKACKDCSACKYCDPKNPSHGSCGVMRDQNGQAAAIRDRKRQRLVR